jgi:hypothetical protein
MKKINFILKKIIIPFYFRIDFNNFSLHIYNTKNWTMYWFCIYHFSILRFHVVNLIILFIARLMAISAPMATINMRSRTTDYTAMARVAQKWLQLKKYWYYRFQSYCIRLQIKFRIGWSTLISDKPLFSCPEYTLFIMSALRSPERCLDVPLKR